MLLQITHYTYWTWFYIILDYFQNSPQLIALNKNLQQCFEEKFYLFLASRLLEQHPGAETYLLIFENKETRHLIFQLKIDIDTLVLHGIGT